MKHDTKTSNLSTCILSFWKAKAGQKYTHCLYVPILHIFYMQLTRYIAFLPARRQSILHYTTCMESRVFDFPNSLWKAQLPQPTLRIPCHTAYSQPRARQAGRPWRSWKFAEHQQSNLRPLLVYIRRPSKLRTGRTYTDLPRQLSCREHMLRLASGQCSPTRNATRAVNTYMPRDRGTTHVQTHAQARIHAPNTHDKLTQPRTRPFKYSRVASDTGPSTSGLLYTSYKFAQPHLTHMSLYPRFDDVVLWACLAEMAEGDSR